MGYLLNLQIKMANSVQNSVKVSFNETTYKFLLENVKETDVHTVRRIYIILINGVEDSRRLIYTTMKGEPRACYEVLVPTDSNPNAYTTPYKQYYDKGLPMDITFDIIKFLNK
jgi:hypothetical protein